MSEHTHFDNGRWRLVVYRRSIAAVDGSRKLSVYAINAAGDKHYPTRCFIGRWIGFWQSFVPKYVQREADRLFAKKYGKAVRLSDYEGIV